LSISDQIHAILVQHPLPVLVGTVVAGYCVLHILRKRRERRRQSEFHIPNFLSGRTDSGNDTSGGFKGQWTEIYPGPRPRPRPRKD
jgi:hypothetical protein